MGLLRVKCHNISVFTARSAGLGSAHILSSLHSLQPLSEVTTLWLTLYLNITPPQAHFFLSTTHHFRSPQPWPERPVHSWPLAPCAPFRWRPDPWPRCGRAELSPRFLLWWTAAPGSRTPAFCSLSESRLRPPRTSGCPRGGVREGRLTPLRVTRWLNREVQQWCCEMF